MGFQISDGINAEFGCVDGGVWVAISILVGLNCVWLV